MNAGCNLIESNVVNCGMCLVTSKVRKRRWHKNKKMWKETDTKTRQKSQQGKVATWNECYMEECNLRCVPHEESTKAKSVPCNNYNIKQVKTESPNWKIATGKKCNKRRMQKGKSATWKECYNWRMQKIKGATWKEWNTKKCNVKREQCEKKQYENSAIWT